MDDKKYPLDITVACSIGLEGGLARFKNELPDFSKDDFELVHEWNRNLKKTMKEPEFKEYMGKTYRVLLNLPARTVSKIIDKLAVPYRSYYYAKRFLDAAHFVYNRAEQDANVVDFGRGLSPWGYVVKKNCPYVNMFTFDRDETNSVFKAVSKKMNLQTPNFNKWPFAEFNRDFFVSLGTFVYLEKSEQQDKLVQASTRFKNLFIELEKANAAQDDKAVVNDLGTEYNPGFSKDEVTDFVGDWMPFEIREVGDRVQNARLAKSLKNATEMFVVR